MVKASLFAYDPKTGHMVWESGPLLNAKGCGTTSWSARVPTG